MSIKTILNGDTKRLRELKKEVHIINELSNYYATLSDQELQAKTNEFKKRLEFGQTLNDIKHEAFAAAREACKRTLGVYPYDEQVMGGLVIHSGDISEQATGSGKAITLDTKIPTPNGWIKAKDVKIGDLLFDHHGNPTTVLGVYPQGKQKVYEVHFTDHKIVKCNSDHLWSICQKDALKTVTTTEIQKLLKTELITIPYCKPVDYSPKQYNIKPYNFGQLMRQQYDLDLSLNYNLGSINQRIDFLKGVFDWKNETTSFDLLTYHTSSISYKDYVLEVISSLGFGYKTKYKNGLYTISFSKYPEHIIEKIIETSNEEEQVCFKVDNPAHLFLINDYVVTHNTITATMPAYLNALTGKGVHIITVNEYLSTRDAIDMGELYAFLGLSTGINSSQKNPQEKRDAYACDITYTTNAELGFDYLRDNMVMTKEDKVQRGLHYAIIDEADSILIDEAKTPLIISNNPKNQSLFWFNRADRFVKTLNFDDVIIDETSKSVYLSESGYKKASSWFNVENIYDSNHIHMAHHIANALQANFIFQRNKDYLIKNDELCIIDTFTGRVMDGRRFSDGLHQALEAKENVQIQKDNYISATITYQNFFRLYDKISGMTGTAKTEEEELRDIYNFRVIPIPTHEPVIREDLDDIMYISASQKFKAVCDEIEKIHKTGQPILVGTASVENSMYLSGLLTKKQIPHEVLNAKNHEKEAQIILNAGQKNAITIATNMAGRGTDIKLGEGVRELGGLYVIGTERHESRRIDNQLRGRSGRQGDPGKSRFYLSFEDDLMTRFGSDKIKQLVESNNDDNTNLSHKFINKQVSNAQMRIEGNNYDSRKQVLEYDDIISEQRNTIYAMRDEILNSTNLNDIVLEILIQAHQNLMQLNKHRQTEDLIRILQRLELEPTIEIDALNAHFIMSFYNLIDTIANNQVQHILRYIILSSIDKFWLLQIDLLEQIKRSIQLRQYAQNNPIVEFLKESQKLYNDMLMDIQYEVVNLILNGKFQIEYKNINAGDSIPIGNFDM